MEWLTADELLLHSHKLLLLTTGLLWLQENVLLLFLLRTALWPLLDDYLLLLTAWLSLLANDDRLLLRHLDELLTRLLLVDELRLQLLETVCTAQSVDLVTHGRARSWACVSTKVARTLLKHHWLLLLDVLDVATLWNGAKAKV